jgi:hypothetical protein
MNTTLAASQPLLVAALGMAALLSVSAGRDEPWHGERDRLTCPAWLPWAVLGGIATASTIFGILYPEQFAAAAGRM